MSGASIECRPAVRRGAPARTVPVVCPEWWLALRSAETAAFLALAGVRLTYAMPSLEASRIFGPAGPAGHSPCRAKHLCRDHPATAPHTPIQVVNP